MPSINPKLQRQCIMSLLVKNEGRYLLCDEIVEVYQHKFSRNTVYRRLAELETNGWVERIWLWNMPMPRYGVSDAANEHLLKLLVSIVERAGSVGITENDANDRLLRAVVEGALKLEKRVQAADPIDDGNRRPDQPEF
jgi:Fe2+ or Zn2+ uptake regulation protein